MYDMDFIPTNSVKNGIGLHGNAGTILPSVFKNEIMPAFHSLGNEVEYERS
jgi:hypothetical protein